MAAPYNAKKMKEMADVFSTEGDKPLYDKIDSFKNKLSGFLGGGSEAKADTLKEAIKRRQQKLQANDE